MTFLFVEWYLQEGFLATWSHSPTEESSPFPAEGNDNLKVDVTEESSHLEEKGANSCQDDSSIIQECQPSSFVKKSLSDADEDRSLSAMEVSNHIPLEMKELSLRNDKDLDHNQSDYTQNEDHEPGLLEKESQSDISEIQSLSLMETCDNYGTSMKKIDPSKDTDTDCNLPDCTQNQTHEPVSFIRESQSEAYEVQSPVFSLAPSEYSTGIDRITTMPSPSGILLCEIQSGSSSSTNCSSSRHNCCSSNSNGSQTNETYEEDFEEESDASDVKPGSIQPTDKTNSTPKLDPEQGYAIT